MSSHLHRICYDKLLPGDLLQAHETLPIAPGARGPARAVMPNGKRWLNTSKLRVRFIGATEQQRALVKQFAPTWSEFANLDFVFDDSPQAEIRISFDPTDGSWSYVGTDCRGIPLPGATMNLGWQDEAVILHEFGHAIGLAHEHQNPVGGIEWNEEVVIRDLGGAPNFWDPETVRHNVLRKYAANQVNGTNFDPNSIMLYAFPGTWTKSGQGTKENVKLSSLDQSFVRGAYPGNAPAPESVKLEVAQISVRAASIAKPGEQNLFSFQADKSGTYTIETEGTTDVVMKLFGPNSTTQLILEDDDGGEGSNARISTNLVPGSYYLQVRHYDQSATGSYGIKVYR
jgi:Astacin (Peptidase family M12A)/Bacterial pre-peptidase C-terminal domain